MKKIESCKTIKSPLALGFILLFSFISFFGYASQQNQTFTYKPTTESLYSLKGKSKKTFVLSKYNFSKTTFSNFHALKSLREKIIILTFQNRIDILFKALQKDPIEIILHNKLLRVTLKTSSEEPYTI